MLPRDWLLLFIAARSDRPVDPVRLQKGLFLLAMRGVVPDAERYAFEAYSYGPMSRAIYRDARELRARGLVEAAEVGGQAWRTLRATPAGLARAAHLRAEPGRAAALAEVGATRAEVDGLAFAELLARIYEAFPEFAVRSVFRP
jgi:uncharacterized protein YwgA